MGVVALLAICVGFGRTYAVPMMRGTFGGPRVLHIHGAFALAWVLLFIAQPLLVRWRLYRAHRALGYVGLPLALAVAVTMESMRTKQIAGAGAWKIKYQVQAAAAAARTSTVRRHRQSI
jgi:hypothetical protein